MHRISLESTLPTPNRETQMMKRLVATGIATFALGGGLLAAPALAAESATSNGASVTASDHDGRNHHRGDHRDRYRDHRGHFKKYCYKRVYRYHKHHRWYTYKVRHCYRY
jgi:hypothetical protein